MRRGPPLLPPALLASLALLAAPAAAHEEPYAVGQVFLGTLPGGVEETFDLTPPNGTLPQGMLVLANVIVYQGAATLEVGLALENSTLARWTAAPGGVNRVLAAQTPSPGAYHLTLRNPGPGEARVGFYFDLACACPTKELPIAVPGGVLVFPLDAVPGSAWVARVQEPPVHRLAVTAATFDKAGAATWPHDFAVLQRSSEADATGRHEVRFEAPQGGRHYLVVHGTAQRNEAIDLSSDAALRAGTLVQPTFERLPSSAATPVPPVLAVLALLAAAVAAGLRKR